MSTHPSNSTRVTANCSFCGKESTKVKKLIAGPGVYICDECVGLCTEIVATSAPTGESAAAPRATFEQWSNDEILQVLPGVARNADATDSILSDLVGRLRADQVSWPTIATHLGLDPETAQERFEGP